MSINEQLLEEYKKYDYLNQNKQHPLIKILVSYIKPSFLYKSEILTPIHLGRAVEKDNSKDGVISDEGIQWLHENCIGDDGFEGNISSVNRRVGFLTGTYWAWKNYEKLGNPEYFGSFGYRRLFSPKFFKHLNDFDLIIPQKAGDIASTTKNCLIASHGINLYNAAKSIIKSLYPADLDLYENYMNLHQGYYFEVYVMKKYLFFEFCEWIFPILIQLLTIQQDIIISQAEKNNIINYFKNMSQQMLCNEHNFEMYQMRNIGFILERITGYFLYKKSKEIKTMETPVIQTEDFSRKLQKLRQYIKRC